MKPCRPGGEMGRPRGCRGQHAKARREPRRPDPDGVALGGSVGPAMPEEGEQRERGSGGSTWRHRERVSPAAPRPPCSEAARPELQSPPEQATPPGAGRFPPRVLLGHHSSPGT